MADAKKTEQVWHGGWYAPARQTPSSNYDARPCQVQPELIVLHSISLPPGEYGNGCIEKLFLNQLEWSAHPYFEKIRGLKVSSHFVIDREGWLTQYVSCDDRAWHAGRSSWQGRDECNDWSIGVELEGLEGEFFEDAQYETLVKLINDICKAYPIRWVAGHEHVAPLRKIDPGAGFDWGRV
ncbi:MAG: 1,6-anhydro-N-acetylmuramyl-L-alanine amidase AmpD, partial [Saezia sp.]